jgi:hypothetical protein
MEIIVDFHWYDYGASMYDPRKPVRSLKDHKATENLFFAIVCQPFKPE